MLEWFRFNKGIKHNYNLKEMYKIANISKQSMWKYRKKKISNNDEIKNAIKIIKTERKNHKRMGCRKIYYKYCSKISFGRDIFEQICFSNGFKLNSKRSKIKTTWSQRVHVFPNLAEGLEIDNINQLWQSDISYYLIEDKTYYMITIEDVYSRELLALHFSKSLRAEENEKAFKQALLMRKGYDLTGCIFHSDKGSQYISDVQLSMLKETGMKGSMCNLPQENAYVERLHGIIKQEYLDELQITEKNIHTMSQKIKKYYNEERPHSRLNMMTPNDYEKHVKNMLKEDRAKMRIYQWSQSY